MSKRKKPNPAPPPVESEVPGSESVTTRASVPPEVQEPMRERAELDPHEEPTAIAVAPRTTLSNEPVSMRAQAPDSAPRSESIEFRVASDSSSEFDAEMTVNLAGELRLPGRDDLDAPTVASSGEDMAEVDRILVQRKHLRGLVEALVFASDSPIKPPELAKLARAAQKQVTEVLAEIKHDYSKRGIHLDEIAGGWVFRTSPEFAPFVRDLTKQKPVRLTRAQVETLAIIAYRQPITRPEIDDVRGVDTGPVLKLLLERDLVRILGKRDEPGRPLIYGTTANFLEFFGLKSLKDLPTLREFTELSDESRDAFEEELGETPDDAARRDVARQSREEADDDSAPALAPDDGHVRAIPGEVQELDDEEPHAVSDDEPTLTSEAPSHDD